MNRTKYFQERAEEHRAYLLKMLGDKCIECDSIDELEFDHKDPKTKLFNISTRLPYYSLERLIEEAKKCQLLCHDCHIVKHDKKEVDHGSGVAGKWKCKCHLCSEKRAEYYRNKHLQNSA